MNNQVLKYLYSQITKSINENSERDFQTFQRADNIIIWIVGFSIGILVILFSSDFKDSNQILNEKLVPRIAITALSVIIFGLIFRVFSFFTQMVYSKIIVSFGSYASSFANAPEFSSPRVIKDSDRLEDLVHYFKEDFEIILKGDYKNFPQDRIDEYRQLHINYYNALAESNDFDKQLEEYKKQLRNHFGMSKKSIENSILNDKKIIFRGFLYRILMWICYVFFSLTIGSFIFGTVIILNNILKFN